MFKTLKKRINNERGLTLIELLAVIVILAIVAAIAVPAIGNIIDNSRYKAVKADAINVLNAANLYFTENESQTTVDVPTLISNGFLESPGKIPNADTSDISNAGTNLTLTTAEIDYDGKNNITFSGATIDEINAHTAKTDTTVGD